MFLYLKEIESETLTALYSLTKYMKCTGSNKGHGEKEKYYFSYKINEIIK